MFAQKLILTDAPEGTIPLHGSTQVWACPGCLAHLRGQTITHPDDCPVIAGVQAEERERVYAVLGNDHHVTFTDDGWVIEHSVTCRLAGTMADCENNQAVRLLAEEVGLARTGRWLITGINSEGFPRLVRAGR
jgi:hypothetical protein